MGREGWGQTCGLPGLCQAASAIPAGASGPAAPGRGAEGGTGPPAPGAAAGGAPRRRGARCAQPAAAGRQMAGLGRCCHADALSLRPGAVGTAALQAGRTGYLQTPATSTLRALMPGNWPAPAKAVTQGEASHPACCSCGELLPAEPWLQGRCLLAAEGRTSPLCPAGKTLLCRQAPACRSVGSDTALQQEQSQHGARAGGPWAAATWNKAGTPSPMGVVRLRCVPGPQTSARQNRCPSAGMTNTRMLLNSNFNNAGQSQWRLLPLATALVQTRVLSLFQ